MGRLHFGTSLPGLYQASTRGIAARYKEALEAAGFRPFAGENAKRQPPDVPDALHHENVVAWVRKYFRKNPYKKSGTQAERKNAFLECLRGCERHINREYDVAALCASFPERVEELVRRRGDRLGS